MRRLQFQHYRSFMLAFMSCVVFASAASATDGDQLHVDNEQLMQQVSRQVMLEATSAHPDALIDVKVAPLNARIQLESCDTPIVTPRGNRRYGRIPVAVSCSKPQWNVFMTATVRVQKAVVVAKAPLARGKLLSAADLTIRMTDLTELRQQFYEDATHLSGMQLKRPLQAGSVLYGSMVKVPIAVRRGDKVAIVARRGSVHISVPGESLENGMPGEQIRVRNHQSKKVVHVWVKSAGVVTTQPQSSEDTADERQIANLH